MGFELRQQVEVRDVSRENGESRLGCRQEDQGVVEYLPLFGLAILLESCQHSGEDAGLPPNLTVRSHDAVTRSAFDCGEHLMKCLRCIRMNRIEQASKG